MISLFDEDALKEEGVLRLRRIYPRCPVCNEERPYVDILPSLKEGDSCFTEIRRCCITATQDF